jgi:ferritin-like metal-binding protein YciE
MTTQPREHLLDWLRDAYAMEQQALEMCERQAERIERYPELRARIVRHIDETKEQIAKLDRCFSILGETPSAVKSAIGWTIGNMQALGGMLASDEIVKGAMAGFVFENMEIASYTILIAAAEKAGEPEIVRLCMEIREQEQAMADFLREHLPETTAQFMQRDATEQPARI